MKRRARPLLKTLATGGTALLLAGCAGVVQGHAVSPLYDPFRVAGLPAEDGPSGVKDGAPDPEGDVKDTDNGDLDKLALLSVNDVADYWQQNYGESLDGTFTPIENLLSYDSDDPSSPTVCGQDLYQEPNAFFCPSKDLMAWDRGVLVPIGQQFFGDVSIAALLGHEYGHAVQHMADIVDDSTPTIVSEQQADCFAGGYIRWVAEGQSPRFTLSTGDGLNHVLAAAITLRDPIIEPGEGAMLEEGHGTALDRVSAFQMGFAGSPADCAKIDLDEIQQRRGDLPMQLPRDDSGEVQSGDITLDEGTLSTLMEVLGEIFKPERGTDAVDERRGLRRRQAEPTGVVLPVHQHDLGGPVRDAGTRRGGQRAQQGADPGRQHRAVGVDVALRACGPAREGRPTRHGGRRPAHGVPDRLRAGRDVLPPSSYRAAGT